MANSLTAASPAFWSARMGRKLYKNVIYKSVASSEEQSRLSFGVSVDRPYRSDLRVQNYVKGTAATAQDITATSDKLTIDKQKTILIYVDEVDKLQSNYDLAMYWSDEMGKRMGEQIDAEFLYEVVNANNTVDDADLGGTSGNPFAASVTNVQLVASKINRKLDERNVPMDGRFWAISPQLKDFIWQYIAGKESLLGDKTTEFGNLGKFAGLDLYVTNNLAASAIWTPANNPSNGDTITIGGITFTFVNSIGTTAGNVLIAGSTALTLDNLVALINDPSTTNANQVGFTGTSLDTVSNMVAVDGTTYLQVYQKGISYITVTGSDATDIWSKKTQHSLAGLKGSIDLVIQKNPDVQSAPMASVGKRGSNYMALSVFGTKTFNQGKNQIVNVKVDSSSF